MTYQKLIIIAFGSMLYFQSTFAQTMIGPLQAQSDHFEKVNHCAPNSMLLATDISLNRNLDELMNKYPFIQQQDQYLIPALMKISPDFPQEKLEEFSIKVNTKANDIYSIQIPLNSYKEFITTDGIVYLELAHQLNPRLDKALTEAKVDLVHQGENLSKAYTGQDVVIGILDLGFDYTHPSFTDAQGESRIQKSWEQNINRIPPMGFSYGNELGSKEEVLAEKFDASDIGHGTHVANVAAGSGGPLKEKYRGIAYESELVFVSLFQLGGISGLNTGVIDGINYVFQYAESIGKPAVVNLSQGHHTGPHDGTSLTDQAIDALTGSGKIVVGAVGNEGDISGNFLHLDHTFDNENEILSYLAWPSGISAGQTTVDIWGEVGETFTINIELYNPKTKMLEIVSESLSTENPIVFTNGILVDVENDTVRYEGVVEVNPVNNRPHIALYINSTAQSQNDHVNFEDLLDNDFIQLRLRGVSGMVHGYAANNSGQAFFSNLSVIGADEFIDEVRILGGNENYTMGELGGTAHSIISVGAYTTKNSFTNTSMDQIGIEDVLGDYYFKSSRGPTHDGRIKPDVSAPGNLVAAAANSFNVNFDEAIEVDKIDKDDNGKWSFTIRRGTSVASPIVAGIVALMLEINPDLDPSEVKEMLQNLSEEDNFTGTVPNNLWGYGKINAHQIISTLDNVTSLNEFQFENELGIYPNPSTGIVYLPNINPSKNLIKVVDVKGREIYETRLSMDIKSKGIDLSFLENGLYFLLLDQEDSVQYSKVVIER